jgi:DNA-binding protein Fis
MLCEFIGTLNEQETATLFLLMAEIEKDRSSIQRILNYITGNQSKQTSL